VGLPDRTAYSVVTTMLSHQQILHFRTFGYVVLRGLLSPAEAATLHQEVTGALADAFGKIATEPDDLGGISGDYLPLAASRAPFSLALIADDERTFGSSAELLGGPAVPSVGIATCFTGDSTWHTRHGPDIGGVSLWADLERRTAGTGALRLVPGSHLPEFERRLCEYRAAEPASSGFGRWEWPHVVVATEPGDVVAFHAHLMTCAQGGTPRLSWTIDYLPWPGLSRPDQMAVVRDLVRDSVEFDHEDYDRDRWPVWRDWVIGAAQIPSRAIALERLELLGVLAGQDDG
jgi:Phytanoyl-CoA dioxygenase (PhyH)